MHMRRDGAELAELLGRQQGYIYVCGDAKHMAKDVHSALLALLQQHLVRLPYRLEVSHARHLNGVRALQCGLRSTDTHTHTPWHTPEMFLSWSTNRFTRLMGPSCRGTMRRLLSQPSSAWLSRGGIRRMSGDQLVLCHLCCGLQNSE